MSNAIFLLSAEGLVELSEAPYDTEAVLQELLATHPQLLVAGSGDGSARRLMLVKRELTLVHDTSGASWSVDHLFLDQDAVPTIVEVKQSSNPEIRRSMVGQMLDYAANAVIYWPIEGVRAAFEATCEKDGLDPSVRITELVGPDQGQSVDEFWEQVRTNLQAQRLRLVFVADEIPAELRRIIEFLNGQMSPAEVMGVEVKQFVGGQLKTLVPRVVGQTAEAEQRKGIGRRTDWSWEKYASELNVPAQRLEVGKALVEALTKTAQEKGLQLTVNFVKGYVSFLRSGGYKVLGVDVWWRKVPRFAVKIPSAPSELGLVNPYPDLSEDWNEEEKEWSWTVPTVADIPDLGLAIEQAKGFHPESGSMLTSLPGT